VSKGDSYPTLKMRYLGMGVITYKGLECQHLVVGGFHAPKDVHHYARSLQGGHGYLGMPNLLSNGPILFICLTSNCGSITIPCSKCYSIGIIFLYLK